MTEPGSTPRQSVAAGYSERLRRMSPQQRELVERALRAKGIDLAQVEITPRPDPARTTFPLSFAQQRLWFLHQLEPGTSAYHLQVPMVLHGDLDVRSLRRALNEVVRRHEVLRSVFVTEAGEPVQRLRAELTLALPVVDLAGLEAARRERQLRRLVTPATQRPFDLGRGPLLRALLVRLDGKRGAGRRHGLVLTKHHIITDQWSFGLFSRELMTLYQAYSTGQPSPLPELTLQYPDFSLWQRKWLRGEVLERQLTYWRGRLAGGAPGSGSAVPVLELAPDRARGATTSNRGAICSTTLPPELTEGLKALARAEKSTPFIVLLAGFEALLGRLTGQRDFTVGSTIANRNRREIEGLIGFFVNTRVLRAELGGNPSFREVVRRTRADVLGAEQHQDLPFERLVEELAPERSLQRPPLFQVTFNMLPAGGDPTRQPIEVPALRAEPLPIEVRDLPFDLTLRVTDATTAYGVSIDYRRELFDGTRMRRMLRSYVRLLTEGIARPDVPLAALDLLTAQARHQMLAEWNDYDRDHCADHGEEPGGGTVHGLFELQARATPNAPAARFEGEALTYGELDARANRLARHLRALGVETDDPVGLMMERSLDLVVAVLGILKAGAGYLPLDPGYPAERLAFMVEDAGMPVLVSAGELADALPATGAKVLRVDRDAAAIAAQSAEPLALRVSPEGLCYAIFTSGSTGRPKGTLVTHRALHNRMLWFQKTYGLRADDRVLQKTPTSFDVSVWELFWPLTTGASIVLARPGGHMDAPYLLELLIAEGVTTLHFVPSMLRIFLAQPGVERLASEGRVRRVVASGEALTLDLQRSFFERFGREVPLHNMYGPSEAARASFQRVDPEGSRPVVPIGRPVTNDRLYVLDPRQRAVPIGVPGELAIGGIGLARGYHRRPRLTARKFLPDPYAAHSAFPAPGARLYRTGDLTRTLPDGRIEFLGRIDHQVKVRGMRVELGEIDAALEGHPAVRDAVVVVREASPGDQRLIAYLVAHEGEELSAPALRRFLAARLPDYMVPAAMVLLEAMPLTPSGKTDRRALPAPAAARPELEGEYVAPRTPLEESLAEIWADVLGVDRVGARDGFFELGGHSLLATQVVARVRATLAVEVPLRSLFETPTLDRWAREVERLRDAEGGEVASIPPLLPAPRDASTALPLSFAQQRLWFLDQLMPDNPFYNMFTGLRLAGRLDRAVLTATFREIVRRHEALRTRFPALGGEPRQVIEPPSTVSIPEVDLRRLPEAARRRTLARLAAIERNLPFDLAAGPLLRVRLVRLAGDEAALLLNVHHIVSDGWSTGVLYRELIALYRARAERGAGFSAGALPEPEIQYADYALWQRRWLSGDELAKQVGFWRRNLAGAPPALALPFDRPRPEVERFRGSTLPFRFPRPLAEAARGLGRQAGTTLFMTLLAGFKLLLQRYTGQSDLVAGSGIANRRFREIEGLIGFFVNTLVLRTDLAGVVTFGDALSRVRTSTLEAYAHQDLPFEKLVDELQVERTLSHNPICQLLFVVQNYPVRYDPAELPGLQVLPLAAAGQEGAASGGAGLDTGTAKFDLTVYLREIGGELTGAIEYNVDLFDRSTVRRLIDHYVRLLEGVVADPDGALTGVSLLDAFERQQLVCEWGRNVRPYPERASLPELFSAAAGRAPAATALQAGELAIPYGELDRLSNRLAHHLLRLGVEPEERVALALPRSPRLVVAILAVLKAGAAYVPLDLECPLVRLERMVREAGARRVLVAEGLELKLPASLTPIELSADPEALAAEPDGPTGVPVHADQLAYVMFTSGSTGEPKGVAVTHRNVVRLVQGGDFACFGPDEVFLMLAPASFDASTLELWGPLTHGGTLALFPPHKPSLEELAAEIEARGVTTLWLTSGLFHQMVDTGLESLRGLRHLLAGGDVLSPRHVKRALAALPGTTVVDGYGPTENTTFTCCHPMRRPSEVRSPVPVGRPISNTEVLILDRAGQPAPIAVTGQLWAGGDGVTRGYLGRPAATAEKFRPHPFPRRPGERVYGTGDGARWLPDGRVEFLGRDDQQVKLRGFRIELGEIESALSAHPAVAESVVVARHEPAAAGGAGDKKLVAYVVQDADYRGPEESDEAAQSEQVEEWSMLFDDLYRKEAADEDPTFNVIGWDSTYTGAPLPKAEMREWLDDTVERILSLSPRRCLELGCGTGMLLFRVAPRCERYLATDVSAQAIAYLRELVAERLPQVELEQRGAEEREGIEPGSFDTVILNSVAQYFPSADYLAEVVEGALRAVRPGGAVFLGDLRSQPLQETFYADLERFQAADDDPLATIQARARRRRLQENELAVDPSFFTALARRLPRLDRVEVYPKRGAAHNELTAFRYQVVLRVGEGASPAVVEDRSALLDWVDWRRAELGLERLRRGLAEDSPPVLGLRDIPNARLAGAAAALAALEAGGAADGAELRAVAAAAEQSGNAVEPDALRALGEELGYEVELAWTAPGAEGRFDAVFRRRGAPGVPELGALLPEPRMPPPGRSLASFTTNPMQGRFVRRVVPEMRGHLSQVLPEYMVPNAFVLLDELPLTVNGKVDRRALPAPDAGGRGADAPYVAPAGERELALARIWEEVLGVERVGLRDNFFELGGHSLLATQVVSRLRKTFEVEIPLRAFFETQTLGKLAEYLDAVLWARREAPSGSGEAMAEAGTELGSAVVGVGVAEGASTQISGAQRSSAGEAIEEGEL